ncbi:AzlD domain-containing protein [Sulfidibacter corallicola]|uniref:AzlD domain-containing protein n=1 Tax=Sulfidibacter corallicola TaxID=2818388 RepID=A0A8A4TQZ0_SULCO|nr:AzlD domain-containing protein [Sulfidibacter corallicola]QTD51960.1 AzlD domain-containing protein [Sulfidibacter corallicola]
MHINHPIWFAMLAIGAGTFVFRFSFIGMLSRLNVPQSFERILKYIPVAVLSALIVPSLVIHQGHPDLSFSNLRLLAGVAAMVVAATTRKIFPTLAVGMGTLWLLMYLTG